MTAFQLTTNQVNQRLDRVPLKQQMRMYQSALLLNDIFATTLALVIAYGIRFQSDLGVFQTDSPPIHYLYAWVTVGMVILIVGLFAAHGLYSASKLLGGTEEYALVFRACTVAVVASLALQVFLHSLVLARAWQLLVWLLTFVLVGFGRFWLRRAVYRLRIKGWFLTPAVLIGANAEGLSLAEQLLEWRTSGLHIIGFVDEEQPVGALVHAHLRCLGRTADLARIIDEHNVGNLVVATSALGRSDIVALFRRYGGHDQLQLHLSSGLFETITTDISVQEFVAAPLVRINRVKLTGFNALLKRSIDIVASLLLLIGLSPLFALLAVLVRRDSPGPVVYRRGVVGLNGRRFDAFKFRTMVTNGDELLAQYPDLQKELAENHKLKEDPRITKIGRMLRKTSLDELPQLLNVLKGEMSLVGPRMITPAEIEKYGQWGLNLFTVRPGITGLWQVSGRSDTSYDERIQFDMRYIRNWTIWLDLYILFQTIPSVLKSRGAY